MYIAVMDYTPVLQDQHGKRYWPVIDDALRASAYSRNITVRLLVSKWNHTNPAMVYHLRSLLALNGVMKGRIEIVSKFIIAITIDVTSSCTPFILLVQRWFEVPSFTPEEKAIPFARVNHNKYMVTDTCAYIGRYFIQVLFDSQLKSNVHFLPGTSNWEGSYFTTTAGVSVVLNETRLEPSYDADELTWKNVNFSQGNDNFTTVRDQLESIFLRDWNSKYSSSVTLPRLHASAR